MTTSRMCRGMYMRTKGRRGFAIATAVFIVCALVLYWISGGVLDWLRVTLHGR